jgi:AAA+ superfamily predicted ATPase
VNAPAEHEQGTARQEWPLANALRCLDELLSVSVAELHQIQGADPFRGLHIGPDEVARWLNGPDPAGIPHTTSIVARAVAAALEDPVFRWLADVLTLTPFEIAVVLISLSAELDLRYERLFAYLQDDVAKRRPTIDLILRLLVPDRAGRAAHFGEFAGGAPLVRNRLIIVTAADLPLLAGTVQIDPQILALFLRQTDVDPRLAPFCKIDVPQQCIDNLPITEEWRQKLPALLAEARQNRRPLRFFFEGPPGCGKARLAEAVACALDARLVTVDLRQIREPHANLPLVFRETLLKGGVLYLKGVDALREDDGAVLPELVRLLNSDMGVVIVSGHRPWRATELDSAGLMPLAFDLQEASVQQASWRNALVQAGLKLKDAELSILSTRFRLTPAQAVEAAAAAANSIRWRQSKPGAVNPAAECTLEDLFAAARLQCGQELTSLARRIEPKRCWEDIVLPSESLAQLREICTRISCHERVLHEWGFSRRLSLGKGVTALFAGPSGTGKTLAAEIIAFELGLFLYKVDLSGVVSKYIGETEKNLDRVFTAARDANCVLFFDEADALFGKRSEVRDSHDRYANLEISYLLQKMEEFEGLAILATNLRQNIDEAFTRRLTFTVHFPFPDEAERCRIWSVIWPGSTPLAADVDAGILARELKMSGGNIKNTALAAAYYAAADGGVVTREHLLRAARREFQKMGKVPPVLGKAAVTGTA